MMSVEEKYLKRVRIGDPEECWEFIGVPRTDGYGGVVCNGRAVLLHRAAYTLFVGPIPDGLCVLHKCDNRLCANPAHLFLGTRGDNTKDMMRKGRHMSQCMTHCKHGHEFTPENTGQRVRKGRKLRVCKQCDRDRHNRRNK